MQEDEFQRIVKATRGFSGSDLEHVLKAAAKARLRGIDLAAMRAGEVRSTCCTRFVLHNRATLLTHLLFQTPPITADHILDAVGRRKPSVTSSELSEYVQYNTVHGTKLQ